MSDHGYGCGAPVLLGVDRKAAPARGLQRGDRRAQPQGGGGPLAEVAEGVRIGMAATRSRAHPQYLEEAGRVAVRGVSGPPDRGYANFQEGLHSAYSGGYFAGLGRKMPGVYYVTGDTRRIARKG